MIKVVQITENPIAGAPINLSIALNKYSCGEVESRHIAVSDRNENRIYKSDMILGACSYEEIRSIISDADVLHFHNFYSKQELFRLYPDLWQIALKKPRVWQAHSQRDIGWMDIEEGLRDKQAKHLVIAQYHPRFYPECIIVPNIIDIWDEQYKNAREPNDKLRVSYSPSRIGLKGWDNKGYEETMPILQKLVNEDKITAEVIHNVPHAECLRRRALSDVAIDEIVTGSYHLCSLEAMSQGVIAVAGLDTQQIKVLRDLTGCEELPWIRSTPKTLEDHLTQLSQDMEDVRLRQLFARAWMEKYWAPEIMIQYFIKVYRSI